MRLIDADALKREKRMADRCEDCERNARDCQYVYGYTLMDICSMLDDAPTIGDWISVKDRLPENEQYVILWTKTGVMKYAKYLDDEPHRPWITYDEDGSIRAWDNVVTHWMPLPEPPKEETP